MPPKPAPSPTPEAAPPDAQEFTGKGGGRIVLDHSNGSVRAIPGPLVTLAEAACRGKYRVAPISPTGAPEPWLLIMLALHLERVARAMPEGEAADRAFAEARSARLRALANNPSIPREVIDERVRDTDGFFTAAARPLLAALLAGNDEAVAVMVAFCNAARRAVEVEQGHRDRHVAEMMAQFERPDPALAASLVGLPFDKAIRDLCAVIEWQASMLGKPPPQRDVREMFSTLPPYASRDIGHERNFRRFLDAAGFGWLPRAAKRRSPVDHGPRRPK